MGIPDVGFVDPNFFKDLFQVEGRTVLLTFGLLSPNKGIENVLNALPRFLAEFPDVVYIVLGVTHPNELAGVGRPIGRSWSVWPPRTSGRQVIFCNQFVDLEELKEFIGAADIYITPYLNEAQITSGTLAFAFGAGKALISTPYWHAADLLAEGAGRWCRLQIPRPWPTAILGLLCDDSRRAMRKPAYRLGREMAWPEVAQRYMGSFERARLEARRSRASPWPSRPWRRNFPIAELKLTHLSRMTDRRAFFSTLFSTCRTSAKAIARTIMRVPLFLRS